MFNIPTLPELAQRTARAFRADLKGSDARLWPNNVAVSAKVIAGAVWEGFSFLDYIAKQSVKHLATGPWLVRHAKDYGLARLPATYAEGRVVATGNNGTSIPAGVELQRADGRRYVVTGGGVVQAGAATITVQATEPGRAGNALSGVELAFVSAISGLARAATVGDDGIGLGADEESYESLRERLLHRLRYPPRGGAAADYVAWAREVNGVTRVWVDPVTALNGRTSVGVFFMVDDLYADGVPQPADVAAVAAHIEEVRPAGAVVDVLAPVLAPVNVTIDNLSPDTVEMRDRIVLELRDLFRHEVAVSTLSNPFTLYRSLVSEAISNALGEHHHTLVAPAADTAFTAGQLPSLGTVTFT